VVQYAVQDWHRSYAGVASVPVEHPQTLWAVRQWRRSPITRMDDFSHQLQVA